MRRELHVRFCESGGVQLLSATRLVILCRSAEDAQQALTLVQRWTAAAGLHLHPAKTRLVDMQQSSGFEFLGYHFRRDERRPRKKSLRQLKDAVRQKTRRTHGQSLAVIIRDVNRSLRGWFEYFKHSHGSFRVLDTWIRMRLRSLLRKRAGRRGWARGWDTQRWSSAFFAAQGLFSLTAAHAAYRQSARR